MTRERLIVAAAALACLSSFALAGDAAAPPAPAQVAVGASQETPRGAVEAFRALAADGEWSEAAELVVWPAPADQGAAMPRERTCRALARIIEHRPWLRADRIAGEEANRPGAPSTVVAGSCETSAGKFVLSLVRTPDGWRIAESTVAEVPGAARAIGVWWVAALPWYLTDIQVAHIELWQWAGVVVLATLGVALGWVVSRWIRRGARLEAMQRLGPVAQSVVAVSAPLGVLLSLLAMRVAQPLLVLDAKARENLALGSRAVTVFAIAWAAARWLRIVTAAVEHQMERRGIADATSIVRVGRVVATALVWLLGVAGALQVFGLDLSAVIAGLGIGTAAIALASQQTLANLFGGASLVADRVLHPGDQVTVNGVSGTVERIGIRSTHIRTLDRTLLVVANGDLAQSRIEKLSGRDGFRYATTIGLTYGTPQATVRAIVRELRARLESEPSVERDTLLVNFMAFGASSLDVEVRATFLLEDVAAYRAAVERVNLDFMDIVERSGSGFAFPSRTVYVVADEAKDPAVRREAGAAGA